METLEQRLAAVEDRQRKLGRSLRRWRLACAGLAAGLLVTIGVAATPGAGRSDVPDVVRAKAFQVVDADGKTRAILGRLADVDGDGLQIFRQDGKPGAAVDAITDGGIVTLFGDHQSIVLRTCHHEGEQQTTPVISIQRVDPYQKLWSAP